MKMLLKFRKKEKRKPRSQKANDGMSECFHPRKWTVSVTCMN